MSCQSSKLRLPMHILAVKSSHLRAARLKAMQQFECAGARGILSVVLRVPRFDSKGEDLERFDPRKHRVLRMRDDGNAIVFHDMANDALRILRVCQYGHSVTQNVHFPFTAVLKATDKTKFVVG